MGSDISTVDRHLFSGGGMAPTTPPDDAVSEPLAGEPLTALASSTALFLLYLRIREGDSGLRTI